MHNILQGNKVLRLVILLLGISITHLSGCTAIYQNYLDRKIDPVEAEKRALATKGEINVILLPGCAEKPGEQDTLFSCLKVSRDVHPESVKLPPDEKLYLGHVAEFIVRALKYYQFEESFKDFYGYRIVLKFRKMTPLELRSRNFSDYSSIAVGTASTVAGTATMLPLGVVLFMVDGIKTEFDRQDFEERAMKMELPAPKKNMVIHQLETGGKTFLHIKDEMAQELTGQRSERIKYDDKVTSYMVEECLLEKVSPEEMNLYQKQIELFRKNDTSTKD